MLVLQTHSHPPLLQSRPSQASRCGNVLGLYRYPSIVSEHHLPRLGPRLRPFQTSMPCSNLKLGLESMERNSPCCLVYSEPNLLGCTIWLFLCEISRVNSSAKLIDSLESKIPESYTCSTIYQQRIHTRRSCRTYLAHHQAHGNKSSLASAFSLAS